MLVVGEAGTGRLTLLTELYRRIHEDGVVVAIDVDSAEAAPQDVLARIRRAAPGRVLPVLRDIDRLSRRAVDVLLAASGDGADLPPFAATTTDPRAHERLLAWFQTSATVPPLRNRSGDLPALVASLLAELAPHREVRLSREAMRQVSRYGWPGNVRELADALSTALRRRPVGCIEAADLPEFCQSTPTGDLRPVDRIERDAIVAALRGAHGNRMAACAALGLARSTLYRKIRQYGITD